MAYTYSYSVSIGPCCVGSLQTALQEKFLPPDFAIRVCAVRQRIEIDVHRASGFQWSQHRQNMAWIQQLGYAVNEPVIPFSVQGALAVSLGLFFLALCLLAGTLPWSWILAANLISALATLVLGYESFKRAWKAFKHTRSSTMDTLFSISAAVAMSVSFLACFVPGLPMMMEVGLLLFGFRHLGLALERSILKKLEDGERFTQLAPSRVQVFREETWLEVDVASVSVDEIIQIFPGQMIPLDGVVQNPAIKVTDKTITGQDGEHEMLANSSVLAGLKLCQDSPILHLKVRRGVQDSFLARMDEVLQSRPQEKSPIETKTMQALKYFVPVVIVIALLSGSIMAYGFGLSAGLSCLVAVLASACPCTLGLVVPLAHKIGVEKARRLGLIFADGCALEKAASIRHVVFDLNGTLTEGKPSVLKLELAPDSVAQDPSLQNIVLAMTHVIQSKLLLLVDPNPQVHQGFSASKKIAQALIDFTCQHQVVLDDSSDLAQGHLDLRPGGLIYTLGSQIWRMGNAQFMKDEDVPGDSCQPLDPCSQEIWLSLTQNNQSHRVARFILHDALRADAVSTVQALQRQNIQVYISTGADHPTAMRYANMLGLSEASVFANCIPIEVEGMRQSSKAQCIQQLKQAHHTQPIAMVGDGGNDAAVLAQSDLGIALLHEDTDQRTKKATQVHLLYGKLKPLQILFEIAHETHHWIKRSLMISFIYNLSTVLMASGVLGFVGLMLSPGLGALLMVLQLGGLLAAAYRMHAQPVVYPPSVEAPILRTTSSLSELHSGRACSLDTNLDQQAPSTRVNTVTFFEAVKAEEVIVTANTPFAPSS